MKTDRATARVVGVLLIVGTAARRLGLALSQPLVDASDYVTTLSLHEDRVATGALLGAGPVSGMPISRPRRLHGRDKGTPSAGIAPKGSW